MCGRFAFPSDWADFQELFPDLVIDSEVAERFNVAPTDNIPVLLQERGDPPRLTLVRWGLVPHWADDLAIGNRMINARAESVAEKPSFKSSLKHRRCLIPASGYFEWKKERDGAKAPYYFRFRDGSVLAMAGLWAVNKKATDSEIRTVTIITTEANDLGKKVHHRMPVVLPRSAWRDWVNPQITDVNTVTKYLLPYPSEEMEGYRVSRDVNRPVRDDKGLVEPVED